MKLRSLELITFEAIAKSPARKRPVHALTGALLLFAGALPVASPSQAADLQQQTGPIYAYIEQAEYDIHWQPSVGAFMAPNREQNLRFSLYGDGITVTPREIGDEVLAADPELAWSASMRLESYGRAGLAAETAPVSALQASGHTASAKSEGLVMDFSNDKAGLRQNFTILRKPAGTGPLRLDFSVERCSVDMAIDPSGAFMYLLGSKTRAQVMMRYRDLKVFDANLQSLPASMVKLDDNRFAILVDDRGAAYPVLVDPLATDGYELSPQASSHFGFCVAYMVQQETAPQCGGLLVGAPYYDPGNLAQAGAVFLYYSSGGTLPSSPTWSFTGTQAMERFGYCVADGGPSFNDSRYGAHNILVGAPFYTQGGSSGVGAVFAFYPDFSGGFAYLTSPSWTVIGNQAGAHLGWSLTSANFDNLDTYPDVLVGAPNYSQYGYTQDGQARIYHGASGGLSTSYSWSVTGTANGATLGFSVAIGDVNGDGKYDAIVGAPGQYAGAAFVYLNSGSGNPHTASDTSLAGYQYGDQFGYSLASRYNQNQDGKADLLVGAPGASYGSLTQRGKVYLFRGSSTGVNELAAWTDMGTMSYEYFGTSVALGDMNGDGYADVMIGAPSFSKPSLQLCGLASLYLTTNNVAPYLPSMYHYDEWGLYASSQLGTSVAYGSPLVNGDADFIIGVPGTQSGVFVWKFQP